MSWCPFAKKMELQPESDNQAAIVPVQFIVHSLAAPWTIERTYEYWRDSTNLESHFGLGYDGRLGQYIGTQTRADANAQANPRAISLESAANLQNSDPWTDEQIDTLVRVMDWAAKEHSIPRRKCRSWTDPGFGYHRMFPEWSTGGTACPGDARAKQFNEIVMPRVIAGDVETDTVSLTDADARKVFQTDGAVPAARPPVNNQDYDDGNTVWSAGYTLQTITEGTRKTAVKIDEQKTVLAEILAQAKANGQTLSEIKALLEGGTPS